MTDLQKAAERLNIAKTMMPDENNCWHQGDFVFGECTVDEALHTLSDFALPLLDETPLTEELVRRLLPERYYEGAIAGNLEWNDYSFCFCLHCCGRLFWRSDGEGRTLGQLRALCFALGIGLKGEARCES